MNMITGGDALCHPGSLLSGDGRIVAPYDIEQQPDTGSYHALHDRAEVFNASAKPFTLDYPALSAVQIINGMGVALGDSIIGITALAALRHINPSLHVTLYRPARAPAYVEALYHLAAGIIGEVRRLPWRLADLTGPAPRIDLGNQLFWPAFAVLPMIDFFLWALGTDPAAVPAELKANRWLQRLALPRPSLPRQGEDYVLFCPGASTPLRSIPPAMHKTFVDGLWRRFARPVLGFGAVDHPHYADIRARSATTPQFLSWIKHARFVLTSDSAAVHVAAGFNVPSLAIFSSIAPALRTRDYRLCRAIGLDLPTLRNMHASARLQDIALVEQAYTALDMESLLAADPDRRQRLPPDDPGGAPQ